MAAEPEAADDRDELIGTKIGKYEILTKLGHGGMGRIYEALNPTIDKRVALKLLDPSLAASESAAARFTREARAASAASSPHIVEIFDAGISHEGAPYIVMELLDGEPLSACIERHGRLEPEEAIRIVVQVLRGVRKAHEAGIVHRDLKPDNIFLEHRDHEPPFAKVLDFGVSKISKADGVTTLTREGSVVGTPAYMSPEQAQGEADVDERSDIWSLGAILYECVTGRLPFTGQSYEQIIVRICTERPTPVREIEASVPEELAGVIERCLRRDRDERVPSAAALLSLLGAEAASEARPRPGAARSAASLENDSTLEASGVLLGSGITPSRTSATSRATLLVGAGVLAASVALVMWSRTRAEARLGRPLSDAPAHASVEPMQPSSAAVSTEGAPGQSVSPPPASTAASTVAASASAAAAPATSASAASAAGTSAAPAVRPPPVRPPWTPPPIAPPKAPPPNPGGIAPGIELERG